MPVYTRVHARIPVYTPSYTPRATHGCYQAVSKRCSRHEKGLRFVKAVLVGMCTAVFTVRLDAYLPGIVISSALTRWRILNSYIAYRVQRYRYPGELGYAAAAGVQHRFNTASTVLHVLRYSCFTCFSQRKELFIIYVLRVLNGQTRYSGVIYVSRLPCYTVLPHVTPFTPFYRNQVDVPCIPGTPRISN